MTNYPYCRTVCSFRHHLIYVRLIHTANYSVKPSVLSHFDEGPTSMAVRCFYNFAITTFAIVLCFILFFES